MFVTLLAILAVASPCQSQTQSQTQYELRCPSEVLILASGTQQYVMASDGRLSELSVPPAAGVQARDGTIAEVAVEGEGADSHSVIVLTPPPTTKAAVRHVTVGQSRPTHLQWMPERTLVYEAVADGAFAIFALDVNSDAPSPRRLSPVASSCRTPAVSPTGEMAWTVERHRDGKTVFEDVVVVGTAGPRPGESKNEVPRRKVFEGTNIGALEFSPDGKKLAIGAINELRVIEVATGKELKHWELVSLDQRLYAHAPTEIRWQRDGATLAFTASFVGGVSSPSGEKPPVLFGDREVFVLGADGKLTVGTLPASATDRPTKLRWQMAGG